MGLFVWHLSGMKSLELIPPCGPSKGFDHPSWYNNLRRKEKQMKELDSKCSYMLGRDIILDRVFELC